MKAFPWAGVGTDGMDLRDYFAAKVIQGIVANSALSMEGTLKATQVAYMIADAMMEAREQK